MKLFILLACVLAGCLAQEPQPCSSPPLQTGTFTISTQNEHVWLYAPFLYDGLGQRIRIKEIGTYQNKSFTYDALLLFKQGVMYEINYHDKKCTKRPLKVEFQPMAIPKNASLMGQIVLGSSSEPGQGLPVNTWTGDMPTGTYMMTVTEFGCILVSTVYHTDEYGWVLSSFFNIVYGITDPNELNPPDFCQKAEYNAEPADFLSLFLKKKN